MNQTLIFGTLLTDLSKAFDFLTQDFSDLLATNFLHTALMLVQQTFFYVT